MHRTIVGIAFGLLLASAVPAFAQVPQLTTATYDDWTVRCEVHEAAKTCEMEQTSQVQGQPVSQIAIGRPSKRSPLRVVFQVPINVWLPAGVTFALDDKDPGVSAPFKRCVGTGCFADADLPAALVSRLHAQTQNGKLLFKDAAQRPVTIPVSFKGFAAARRRRRRLSGAVCHGRRECAPDDNSAAGAKRSIQKTCNSAAGNAICRAGKLSNRPLNSVYDFASCVRGAGTVLSKADQE